MQRRDERANGELLRPASTGYARHADVEEATMVQGTNDGYVRLVVRMEQGQMRVVEAREVAGPLVQPDTVAHGLAHELLIGGRRVAVGSMPDAAVARSFSEPGPEGLREHHIQPLDKYDFVIRVPRSELRGADLSNITVNVVSVQANRGNVLSDAPLQQDPGLDVTLVASLTNVADTPVPNSLRQIIESP
jgi:hypothetical protein